MKHAYIDAEDINVTEELVEQGFVALEIDNTVYPRCRLADFFLRDHIAVPATEKAIIHAYLLNPSDDQIGNIISLLDSYLIKCELTEEVAHHFRALIIGLISRWVSAPERSSDVAASKAIALGKIISTFPQISGFIAKFFELNGKLISSFVSSTQQDDIKEALVLAMYRLLDTCKQSVLNKFDWSILMNLNTLSGIRTKICSVYISSIILNLTDIEIGTMFQKHFPVEETLISAHKFLIEERERKLDLFKMASASNDDTPVFPPVCEFSISAWFPQIIEMGTVCVPKCSNATNSFSSEFVITENLVNAVNLITLAISSEVAVLVSGKSGTGKSHVLSHLAQLSGNRLITLYIDDDTDCKSLFGNYICSDIPGEFKYEYGIITKAIKNGDWLLIEDFTHAPQDLQITLSKVIEEKSLSNVGLPFGSVEYNSDFRLFGTSTREDQEPFCQANWINVHIAPYNIDNLRQLIKSRFVSMSERSIYWVLELVCRLRETFHISTRDIIRICKRILAFNSTTEDTIESRLLLFVAFHEVICCKIRHESEVDHFIQNLAELLILPLERIKYVLNELPAATFEYIDDCIKIGHVCIEKDAKHSASTTPAMFSTTKHSLALMRSLLSAIHSSVNDPILLVGETGTGKTTLVQSISNYLGVPLKVINMSQQSDVTDLIGGFKPVDLQTHIISPFREDFDRAFRKIFSVKENMRYIDSCRLMFCEKRWKRLCTLWKMGIDLAKKKCGSSTFSANVSTWEKLETRLKKVQDFVEIVTNDPKRSRVIFSFSEGILIEAIRKGHWILLDEINLACPETINFLSGLLQSSNDSIILHQRGDHDYIDRHPSFRIFGCMNPSTDVGKKELNINLRNKFVEIWVSGLDDRVTICKDSLAEFGYNIDEFQEYQDLLEFIRFYVGKWPTMNADEKDKISKSFASFHMIMKQMVHDGVVCGDSSGVTPHLSMRTLSRSLCYVKNVVNYMSLTRSVYSALKLFYCMLLNDAGQSKADKVINACFNHTMARSTFKVEKAQHHITIDGFQIQMGINPSFKAEDLARSFVMTESVQRNLVNLARAISSGIPILIQGPTSAGKTSMIEYLAKLTDNKFVRINNHEHTDIQEYIGSYVWSDTEDKLVFRDGLLVKALKNGWWIVLDELNLAPSDVLESLNRLLDDNRELLITETGKIIKPAPGFMLFATQNPSGSVYGGRKYLSRAFRNRFVELNVTSIPSSELAFILHKKCNLAPSYADKLVSIYTDLQKARSNSRLLDGKSGFITLRDLFRWANRKIGAGEQALGEEGFLILAERMRTQHERDTIREIIEANLKCKIRGNFLLDGFEVPSVDISQDIVWTKAMKRLYMLVKRCIEHREPVLLVGETGCGKTTVVQLLSKVFSKELLMVNCHYNSESSDFIGSLRPKRQGTMSSPNAMFEWTDGPLVTAMKTGNFFLLDEISLAEDSVLERLNSVLESSRTLVLAEKNSDSIDVENVDAAEGFQFFATMNPGGDFGKKELSPALRNRFTEIWIGTAWQDIDDMELIVAQSLRSLDKVLQSRIVKDMLTILEWFCRNLRQQDIFSPAFERDCPVSLRDIQVWLEFVKNTNIPVHEAFYIGGAITLGDISRFQTSESATADFNDKLMEQLEIISGAAFKFSDYRINNEDPAVFSIGPFRLQRNNPSTANRNSSMVYWAPTPKLNLTKTVIAMCLKGNKPILMEGSPGVGKTSTVTALAKELDQTVLRVNLSEHTDVMDLFGCDVPKSECTPVEGNSSGFHWVDGPLVKAMKSGAWILLDELNLANQTVLEGLNACLDHRASVFIPETNETVKCHPNFRIFATQNPMKQGGSRKGLPKSFLNRFIRIYLDELDLEDMLVIAKSQFIRDLDEQVIETVVRFNVALSDHMRRNSKFGLHGKPWEFNMRDMTRWLDILADDKRRGITSGPSDYLEPLYLLRFRNEEDRSECIALFEELTREPVSKSLYSLEVAPSLFKLGTCAFPRKETRNFCNVSFLPKLGIIKSLLPQMFAAMKALEHRWCPIFIGKTSSGKTSLARSLAHLSNNDIVEISLHSSVDASDLIGYYGQRTIFQGAMQSLELGQAFVKKILKKLLLGFDGSNGAATCQRLLGDLQDLKAADWQNNFRCEFSLLNDKLMTFIDFIRASGFYEPLYSKDVSLLKQSLEEVSIDLEVKSSARSLFEWKDAPLIQAMEQGKWVLLKNANLCSSSVLDRLNSLFEQDGYIYVHEKSDANGEAKIVRPHPDFRIILTVNPEFGELSRAMRNRGVEVYFDEALISESAEDVISVIESRLVPFQSLLNLQSFNNCINFAFQRNESLTFGKIAVFVEMYKYAIFSGYHDAIASLDYLENSMSSADNLGKASISVQRMWPSHVDLELLCKRSEISMTLIRGFLIDEKVMNDSSMDSNMFYLAIAMVGSIKEISSLERLLFSKIKLEPKGIRHLEQLWGQYGCIISRLAIEMLQRILTFFDKHARSKSPHEMTIFDTMYLYSSGAMDLAKCRSLFKNVNERECAIMKKFITALKRTLEGPDMADFRVLTVVAILLSLLIRNDSNSTSYLRFVSEELLKLLDSSHGYEQSDQEIFDKLCVSFVNSNDRALHVSQHSELQFRTHLFDCFSKFSNDGSFNKKIVDLFFAVRNLNADGPVGFTAIYVYKAVEFDFHGITLENFSNQTEELKSLQIAMENDKIHDTKQIFMLEFEFMRRLGAFCGFETNITTSIVAQSETIDTLLGHLSQIYLLLAEYLIKHAIPDQPVDPQLKTFVRNFVDKELLNQIHIEKTSWVNHTALTMGQRYIDRVKGGQAWQEADAIQREVETRLQRHSNETKLRSQSKFDEFFFEFKQFYSLMPDLDVVDTGVLDKIEAFIARFTMSVQNSKGYDDVWYIICFPLLLLERGVQLRMSQKDLLRNEREREFIKLAILGLIPDKIEDPFLELVYTHRRIKSVGYNMSKSDVEKLKSIFDISVYSFIKKQDEEVKREANEASLYVFDDVSSEKEDEDDVSFENWESFASSTDALGSVKRVDGVNMKEQEIMSANIFVDIFGSSKSRTATIHSKSDDTVAESVRRVMLKRPFIEASFDYCAEEVLAYMFRPPTSMNLNSDLALFLSESSIRIDLLLSEFQEHPILKEAAEICRRIVKFKVSNDKSLFLIGMEFLRNKFAEWENFASKTTSLKSLIQKAEDFLMEWKEASVKSWKDSLAREELAQEENALVFWKNIYSLATSDMDSDLLSSAISEFLTSSSVGEFKSRLYLVDSCAKFLKQLGRISLYQVVRNFHNYFSQYLSHVSQWISARKLDTEKDISEQIKILSWKKRDWDTFKLEHDKAKRIIRKSTALFKRHLSTAAVKLISEYHEKSNAQKLYKLENISLAGSVDAKAAENIKSSAQRFTSKIRGKLTARLGYLGDFVNRKDISTCFNHFVDIIACIQETGGDMNSKSVKRTRLKLFADFIQELKCAGLRRKKGANFSIVEFLGTCQPVETGVDTDAYTNLPCNVHVILSRYEILAKLFEGEVSHDLPREQIEKGFQMTQDLVKRYSMMQDRVMIAENTMKDIRSAMSRYTVDSSVPILNADLFERPHSMRASITNVKLVIDQLTKSNTEKWDPSLRACCQLVDESAEILKVRGFISQSKLQHIHNALNEILVTLNNVNPALMKECAVRKRLFFDNVEQWIETPTPLVELHQEVDNVILRVMIAAQDVSDVHLEEILDIETLIPNLEKAINECLGSFTCFDVLENVSLLVHKIEAIPVINDSILLAKLIQLKEVVEVYLQCCSVSLCGLKFLCDTLGRFSVFLVELFISLGLDGFCLPKNDEDDAEDQSNEVDETVDGTGMDEGSGSNDVSSEIEDEEQILGTQTDEKQEQNTSVEDENKGLEIENDFEGQLENISTEETGERDPNDDSDEESNEDGNDVDQRMDDLEDQPAQEVDENFWGSDSEENEMDYEDQDKDQKYSQNQTDEQVLEAADDSLPSGKQENDTEAEAEAEADVGQESADENENECDESCNESQHEQLDSDGADHDPDDMDEDSPHELEDGYSKEETMDTDSESLAEDMDENLDKSQEERENDKAEPRQDKDVVDSTEFDENDIGASIEAKAADRQGRELDQMDSSSSGAAKQSPQNPPKPYEEDVNSQNFVGKVSDIVDISSMSPSEGPEPKSGTFGMDSSSDMIGVATTDTSKTEDLSNIESLPNESKADDSRSDTDVAGQKDSAPPGSLEGHVKLNSDCDPEADFEASSDAGKEGCETLSVETNNELALRLSESLRLILEPTKANKLKGGYKSGKRLDVKKIVPYIASNFRKDGIWMRRTRLGARDYRILVSLDDSKSMKESGAIKTALESVFMLTKALSILETGDLGLVRFGEVVDVVHGFDEPFTAESSSKLLDNFTFLQTKTNLLQLLDSASGILDDSTASSSRDSWKLHIIMSDGVCDNHEVIRAKLLHAFNKRIFTIFVMIDNSKDRMHLMKTKNVEFVDGELVIRDYMDSFPFEYYAIVESAEQLPGILTESLRQWFEKINKV